MNASLLFALLFAAQCPGGTCPPPAVVRGPLGSQVIVAQYPARPQPIRQACPSPRRRGFELFRRRCR